MNHTRRIHRLSFKLDFPAGLAPGDSSHGNVLELARDGSGSPVLRGTALAGVLRQVWRGAIHCDDEAGDRDDRVTRWFGRSAGESDQDGRVQSALEVADCPLDIEKEKTPVWTHHLRDRHQGRVAGGALFSVECCRPGTSAGVTLWLHDAADDPADALDFLRELAGRLKAGVLFGGKTNRGTGFGEVKGAFTYRVYDLKSLDDHAAFLDDHRAWREGKAPSGGEALDPAEIASNRLRVEFVLTIPRGQDFLVADGQGIECDSEPQRVAAADGKDYFRLPGSTLHGLFRSWVARLAAREGKNVADSVKRHRDRFAEKKELNGDDFGWLFTNGDSPKAHDLCPVAALFGSLYKAGRVHITDAFSPCSKSGADPRSLQEVQKRAHVAVDAISGGAVEHLLFDAAVLTGPAEFKVTMLVDDPTEEEARWLARTLKALDLGILRVGSSKSAGRLCLKEPPRVLAQPPGTGGAKIAGIFTSLQPITDSTTHKEAAR